MKSIRLLALDLLLFLLSCQPQSPSLVTIMDGEQITVIQTTERVPLVVVTQAGFNIMPDDRVFLNGMLIPLDQPIPITASITLQLRRAVTLTLVTPDRQQNIQSAARTVGEALYSTGLLISSADLIDPPANTPITEPLTVTFTPARELTVSVDGKVLPIKSSAPTVGEALASAGIPLIGLDYSSPSENEALPLDGQIQVVRVSESVTLTLKPIPYKTETIQSADLEFGQQEVISLGVNGIALTRTRIRYEDGQEVKRVTETESVVQPPQTQVVNAGTKLVSHDIGNLQYWYSLPMYATSYSPCRSGISGCSYSTASGLRARYGVVAMSKDWYYALQGMEVYVPGYGRGVIGDLGGGFPDGRAWIDLGYNENNYQAWSEWVTVYFLGPAPAAIPYILQ
ncbi:MAG: G5 domain-containing protein [Anaerolineales bacterium]|nr:G5 domain-containing protein [Anaerolineales bacterium]